MNIGDMLLYNFVSWKQQQGMSSSFEFCIEIVEDEEEGGHNGKAAQSTIYQAIEDSPDEDFQRVMKLQQIVKSQSLLLEYQQKRKNERLKEIQYTYVNAFTNYLWVHAFGERRDAFILLNNKDIISLSQGLQDEIQAVFRIILDSAPFPLRNQLKPTLPFINDFMNFWPLWHQRIREMIQLQISGSQRIENTFQSEYTFASKMLANLRLNDRIQRFCIQIFQPVLKQLQQVTEQLIVDFSAIYEKWIQIIPKMPMLKRFIDGGEADVKIIRGDIEQLYGRMRNEQEVYVLIEEMVQFQRKENAVSFLVGEVGEDEIMEGLNLRLGWLVWRKLLMNRKKLELLATNLLASIVEAYPRIPIQVKYVVRCFKECSQRRFGALKFQDLKSFFNKVVFSQLFFAQFMNLYQIRSQSNSNVNLTLLALISQKIMFGQQFYQKFKFGFLNQTIVHYIPTVKQFILGFVSDSIHPPPSSFTSILLISFQSIRFIYEMFRSQNMKYSSLQNILINTNHHLIANKGYLLKNIFVALLQKPNVNYINILKPGNKIQRILIQFLLMIDKIAEKNSIATLLQQYRCAEEDTLGSRPSVQLYAIYLLEVLHKENLGVLIDQIYETIQNGKREIQRIKIGLEKAHNYSQNMQKMYMKLLSDGRKRISRMKIQGQINALLNTSLGFQYEIVQGKVCESAETKGDKTMMRCLMDIGECFLHNYQGVDGLYHMFLQRMVQQLQKGVVPDNMMDNAKSILGKKLYSILKLDTYMSPKDTQLYTKMLNHSFITLTMVDMPQYQQQQQLILRQCHILLQELNRPACPDRLLRIFNDITIVFQNVILTTGSASDITADVQLPLMLVTIIRARVRNLVTVIQFVEKFCTDQINSSVLGQTFTVIKSVAYLIQHLDHTKLNLSLEEYQKMKINAEYVIIQ